MAFGQQSGPPASAKQVKELLELLQDAGHTDFRDARGPMGFTQRQGGGKFTRDEADTFIEQLQAAAESGDDASVDRALRKLPAEQLAAELQRRGWIVLEP
jgi:hypothetical protein